MVLILSQAVPARTTALPIKAMEIAGDTKAKVKAGRMETVIIAVETTKTKVMGAAEGPTKAEVMTVAVDPTKVKVKVMVADRIKGTNSRLAASSAQYTFPQRTMS